MAESSIPPSPPFSCGARFLRQESHDSGVFFPVTLWFSIRIRMVDPVPFSMRLSLFSLAFALFALASSPSGAFDAPLVPFFEQHCYECHDDLTAEGGLDLFAVGTELADPATMEKWVRIFDQVDQGIMPPEGEPRPETEAKAAFLKSLEDSLVAAHEAEKGTVLRRLNRREYENTMNDLFGTRLDLANLLPPDGLADGFDTVGEALSLSSVQLERYLEAADAVIEAAIEKRAAPPEVQVISANYLDSRDSEKFLGKTWGRSSDGAVVFYQKTGYPDGSLREASPKLAGHYRIRITGYAHQSDRPLTFSVTAKTYKRGAEQPTLGYFSLPPGKPTTVEFESWIDAGYRLAIQPETLFVDGKEFRDTGAQNWTGPGLAIQGIELEGPLVEEFPSRGHRLLYDGLTRREVEPSNPSAKKKSWYVPQFEVVTDDPQGEAARVFRRVATLAFRRPVEEGQLEPYLDLFASELADGATFDEALRTGLIAIFCSPDFLYLRENPGGLDDHQLAARLSYFLTRTAPDETLRAAGEAGRLSGDRDGLLAQVDRLLAKPDAERFVVDFTDGWLDLRNIEFTAPDAQLFPEFDPYLQESMLDESRVYFRELIDRNLPIGHLVKSDFAMLNERLAEHYGIEGVEGPQLRRVALPADSVRGGFLSQGSVLKVSANGTNTSPVLRGAWVLERIMGVTPPPPPPAVPGVEPDIRGATTLRQLLEKHRNLESCQGCHQLIDPPGFALENFDPIGGWRDAYRTIGGEGEKPDVTVKGRGVRYRIGLPVDPSGESRDYGAFEGYLQFRDQLAGDEIRLAGNLAEKLLTFATGREMGFSDRHEIDRLAQAAVAEGQGVRDLLRAVVASEIFRHK